MEPVKDEEKETPWKVIVEKVEKLEKQMEEFKKKQQSLQDAFHKFYEDQRRRERNF